MNVAQRARNAALQIEVKKDGLSQRQDGRWALRLIIHPNDMPAALSLAPMGTRYVAALVEVGDDEMPVEPAKPAGDGKRQWLELSPAQQAGIRCNEPAFREFLHSRYPGKWQSYDDGDARERVAALVVRDLRAVESRSDIATDPAATVRWHNLDVSYLAWERVQ